MQINRLFEIVYILIDRKTITAKELAERFEVSTRTIYRDIETLSSVGIPIYTNKGRGGGVSILDNYILNKAVLTDEEKSNVLTSLKAVNQIVFNDEDSAIGKLGSLFGSNSNDWIEVDFSSWYGSDDESEMFKSIKNAIISKRMITFTYSSGKGELTQREAEPLKLCFKGMSRYLYAYCRLRNDFRFFKLSRMKNILLNEDHFIRSAPEQIFDNHSIVDEEYVRLKLKISPGAAYRVFDEFDNYTQDADGNYIVETFFPRGEWLFPYISSFGCSCEVLEPVDVRKKTKDEIAKMLNNYL